MGHRHQRGDVVEQHGGDSRLAARAFDGTYAFFERDVREEDRASEGGRRRGAAHRKPLLGPLPRRPARQPEDCWIEASGTVVFEAGVAGAHARHLPRSHRADKATGGAAQPRQAAGSAGATRRAGAGGNRHRAAAQRRGQHRSAHVAGRFRQGAGTDARRHRSSAARRFRLEGRLHRLDRDVEGTRRLCAATYWAPPFRWSPTDFAAEARFAVPHICTRTAVSAA